MNTEPAKIGSEILLWRVDWRVSSKPVKCIELGDGKIKVIGSCMIKQKRDERDESYHETYKEALLRFLANAQRNVNGAAKHLKNAKRHLLVANAKWNSYLASPNEPK